MKPPPWHSGGRAPLRVARAGSRTRRAIELPNAEAIEDQAKARRVAERERLGAALGAELRQLDKPEP